MGYSPKYHAEMKSFGLSREDARDKNDWKPRIKATTG